MLQDRIRLLEPFRQFNLLHQKLEKTSLHYWQQRHLTNGSGQTYTIPYFVHRRLGFQLRLSQDLHCDHDVVRVMAPAGLSKGLDQMLGFGIRNENNGAGQAVSKFRAVTEAWRVCRAEEKDVACGNGTERQQLNRHVVAYTLNDKYTCVSRQRFLDGNAPVG
jgi:hypothetical protein